MTTASGQDGVTAPPSPALSADRRRTLDAVVARILPGTDGPGAHETDAAVAVARALEHRWLRGLRPGIERVLDGLEAQAGQRYARPLPACAPEEQDALLHALDADGNPWGRFVLRIIVGLSLEGLLGDPMHGGNRDCRGWTALGIDPAAVRSGLCREGREA